MNKKNKEAATLPKKKTTISKGKVKKTIRNTLCRPDPVFWPEIPEDQGKILETTLSTYKVDIPEFKKPHWKLLKSIPKHERPKQPKIKKVEGLIFGMRECYDALKNKECSAVIIESTINPRTLIQPLIEACISNKVPVLCLNGLKKISSTNFGIPSSCLGLKNNFLEEFRCKIEDIAKSHTPPQFKNKETDDKKSQEKVENTQVPMKLDDIIKQEIPKSPISFKYLYRSNKKSRVFNPSSEVPKTKKGFIGQDFIKFSDKLEDKKPDSKAYMSMILKRITNNQNRIKRK